MKHDQKFSESLERRALDALDLATADDNLAFLYAKNRLCLLKQRGLGYATWIFAAIWRANRRNQHEEVRRLSLMALMAIEQAQLDGNWKTAWELMALKPPPFADWERMSLESERRDHAHSTMADPSWIAAVAGKARDEEALKKRRGENPAK